MNLQHTDNDLIIISLKYIIVMEINGLEPIAHACKACILPIKLYPLISIKKLLLTIILYIQKVNSKYLNILIKTTIGLEPIAYG